MSQHLLLKAGFLAVLASAGLISSSPLAAKPAAASKAVESTVFVRPHSPIIGPKQAPVTIVEFFDPSCEACLAMYPYVKRIMAEYPEDVRLVIRFLPLHPGSEEAIRMIEAGRSQGKFIPVLEAVLDKQPEWHGGDMTSAWDAAKAAGLNVDKARASLTSPKVTAALAQDQTDKAALDVRGTPTFFVNGKPLAQLSPQQLYEQVRAEVEASRPANGGAKRGADTP
jgi:protein-disulfide isomerase